MAKGKFIVFEGVDSTGKTTISKMTANWLSDEGIDCILTKHPGATPVGEDLRRISKHADYRIPPTTEALINAAANSAFIDEILIPAIEEGTWVIGDRNNYISSIVYQVMSGVTLTSLDRIHEATHPNPPKIDALFILRAEPEVREARKAMREEAKGGQRHDRYESRKDYMEGVNAGYEVLAEEHVDRLCKFVRTTATNSGSGPTPMAFHIDANKSPEEVFDLVRETLRGLLPKRRQQEAAG